jgi:hypothetical protein
MSNILDDHRQHLENDFTPDIQLNEISINMLIKESVYEKID